MKEKSGSSVSCDLAWEIWVLCWANPCVGEAPTALECYHEFPALLEDAPHVECGKLRRLLAGLLLRPTGRLIRQSVEGSVQGLTSHLQRSELLYRGQSMTRFCLSAQRATSVARYFVINCCTIRLQNVVQSLAKVVQCYFAKNFISTQRYKQMSYFL